MGPILQERTPSTILKRVSVKEKVKVKNSENTAVLPSNNNTGGKVIPNQKPQKKTSSLHKNVSSGPDMEPVHRAEIKGQQRNRTKHVKSPNSGTYKMLRTQFEADIRHPRSKPSPSECEEKRQKVQHQSPCCTEAEQNCAAREKTRRALSLPLTPHQIRLPENVRDLGSLRLLEHREDDTDSASDLSDSERLPVLPSPCTPPQLNLRAEIVDSVDLHPHIPGPRTVQTEGDGYKYPDFLPPPFNTWSLRQLAVFLNTEGKRAPRPKPVGQLEMFLERLLQLEWHQIQTIQNESSQPTAASVRRGCAPNGPQIAGLSRPHTAPPTRLSSPKSLRQSQRGFPFPLLSSLSSPSSCQLSRCLCCHVRYPLCNGSCSSYTYQRHSRLSPLLERKTSPSIMHKRSSSESRASALETKATGRPHYPVSPKSYQKPMEVAGNAQKVPQEMSMKGKRQPSAWRGHNTGRVAEAESHKDPPLDARSALDKRIVAANKRDSRLSGKREQKEGQQTEIGVSGAVAGVKRVVSENTSIKGSRAERKLKNTHLFK